MNNSTKYHRPLRVPAGWNGQNKALVIQIDQELSALHMRIDQLEKKLAEKEAVSDEENDELQPEQT